jgi:cysteinyl-tRNA synthetase
LLDFRLLVLQGHFQHTSNFSWKNLEAAHNRLARWRNFAELRWQLIDTEDRAQQQIVLNLIEQAKDALLDNLDTPQALKYIDLAVDQLTAKSTNISLQALNSLLSFVDSALGLQLIANTPDLSTSLKDMITVRQVHRAGGDFRKSDEVRDSLLANGVIIKDTPEGVIWARR